MQTLEEFLHEKAFSFVPDFSGTIQRFDRNGKNLSAWAIGKTVGTAHWQRFGDFATGEDWSWWSRKAISKDEAIALHAAIAEEQKKTKALKSARAKKAMGECQQAWRALGESKSNGAHPYLKKKGLNQTYGTRSNGQILYVPMSRFGKDGEILSNLQRIYPDGTKRFWPGADPKGGWFSFERECPTGISADSEPGTIYICEGFATGASIHDALVACGSDKIHSQQVSLPAETSFGDGRAIREEGDSSRGPDLSNPGSGLEGEYADSPEGERGIPAPVWQDGRGYREDSQTPRTRESRERDGTGSFSTACRITSWIFGDLPDGSSQRISDARASESGSGSLHEGGDPQRQSLHFGQHAPRARAPVPSRQKTGVASTAPNQIEGRNASRNPQERNRGARSQDQGPEPHQQKPGVLESNPSHRSGSAEIDAGRENFLIVCAFTAGNLGAVARDYRKRFPDAVIILCADDDRFTHTTQKDGTRLAANPGRRAARAAAIEVGGLCVFPRFRSPAPDFRGTDFNDLALAEGSNSVYESLIEPTSPDQFDDSAHDERCLVCAEMAPEVVSNAALPVDSATNQRNLRGPTHLVTYGKGGKAFWTPQAIADQILSECGANLIKQGKELFRYTGTHWTRLLDADLHAVMTRAQELCDSQATSDQLAGILKLILFSTRSVPDGVDLYIPDPWSANFVNGTLHIRTRTNGSGDHYETHFLPHHREDYLCTVLPYEYRPAAALSRNDLFDKFLGELFSTEDDAHSKKRALAQLFGACLVPCVPRLFMLFGPPGTGKSTVIKLAARFVTETNACSVDPTEFEGFNMESMAGKLVNYDTDISTSQPIRDSIVKKIEDRVPMRIRRKGIADLMAPLPAVHLFGANKLPPTLDGASRAHSRRWTFLKFGRSFIESGYDRRFSERIFEAGYEGVLKFALEGLHDLLDSRLMYHQPTSSVAAMEEWQEDNDPIAQFLEAVKSGEVLDGNTALCADSEKSESRTKVYNCFAQWMKQNIPSMRPLSHRRFFQGLETKGYHFKKVNGQRQVIGLTLGAGNEALV